MIEEGRSSFIKRRLIQTLLGGFRTALTEEETAPVLLILLQIPVYLVLPVIAFVSALVSEDSITAMAIGGAIAFVLNLII